jgi:predicted  nucleic acid-binding Zn-ribbon protein
VFEDGSKEMLSGCPDCGGNKFQFRPAGDEDALATSDATATVDSSDDPEPPASEATSVAETVGRATTRVRDLVSSDPDPPDGDPNADAEWPGEWGTTSTASGGDDDIIDADARRNARSTDERAEDTAQASARSDVVSPSELETGADRSGNGEIQAAEEPPATSEPTSNAESGTAPDNRDPSAGPDTSADGDVAGEPTGEDPDLAELREQLNDQFESIKILEPGQYELNLMELYDREEYIIALQENGRYVIQVPEQWIGDDPDDR